MSSLRLLLFVVSVLFWVHPLVAGAGSGFDERLSGLLIERPLNAPPGAFGLGTSRAHLLLRFGCGMEVPCGVTSGFLRLDGCPSNRPPCPGRKGPIFNAGEGGPANFVRRSSSM
jgi:hypothetical protein